MGAVEDDLVAYVKDAEEIKEGKEVEGEGRSQQEGGEDQGEVAGLEG